MAKKKEVGGKHDIYEFLPDETITTAEIIELSTVVRIGIGGNTLENLSVDLKRHFKKVA